MTVSEDRCYLDPTCVHGPHKPSDHPCGQGVEKPGEPCRYCGDPIPMEPTAAEQAIGITSPSCPKCWRPVTIADIKEMFTPYGLSVDVTEGGSEVRR